MFDIDIDLHHELRFAVVRASGSLTSDLEAETVVGALQFVPDDDDLVVDLSSLDALSIECADLLRRQLQDRIEWSEAVVVSSKHDVTMQLLRSEVSKVVAVVPTIEHAGRVLDMRGMAAYVDAGS